MKEYDVYIHEGLRIMQSVMREFTDRAIMPVRQKLDDDHDHVIVKGILQELVKTDFFRSPFPEDIGGLGLGISSMAAALGSEELGRGDGGIAVSAGCSVWPFMSAIWADNRTILENFGSQVCGDELKMGCLCMTEPNAGCDVENEFLHGKKIKTTAKQVGDEWVINGQKMWASNSGIADFYCVLCTTDPNAGEDGVALIFVPKDTPGLTFGKFENKAGMASDQNYPMYLDNVRVPLSYRGGAGEGLRALNAQPHHRAHQQRRPGRRQRAGDLRHGPQIHGGARRRRQAHPAALDRGRHARRNGHRT
jgi:acyl-CoA dehydrogenase